MGMELTKVTLDRSHDGQVASIVIPGGKLDHRTATEISWAAASLRDDRSVRAVSIAAEGDDFCVGAAADLEPYDLRPDPAAAIATLRPPVVAAIGGACRSEGFEIALACDIRIGGPSTTLALDHVLSGRLPAWGGSQRLTRTVRPGRALPLALLGSDVAVDEAIGLGLLHRVADEPDDDARQVVESLCARGPLALELTKEAVHRGAELGLRDGLRLEGYLNHQLAVSEDRAEGLAAFFDKRPPDFSGR